MHDCPTVEQPKTHYESIVLRQDEYILNQQAKLTIANYMNQIEGWCSQEKASILMDLIFILKPKVAVEIGVWGGKSLIPMAYALKINEQGKVYGIDPWDKVESAKGMNGQDYKWWNEVNHDLILQNLLEKIARFELNEQIELIRKTSEHAPLISNIDILHIDGNHSKKHSLTDVEKWVPLVRKGGVIIFDDVNWRSTDEAVNWLNKHCTNFAQYHDKDNDWGIWLKS